MESQPWNLPNIVMAALTAPLFRTSSPGPNFRFSENVCSSLRWSSQRNSISVKGGLAEELILFILLRTALKILFSELNSNVTRGTKFYSEMLSNKSTCSYVLWEHSMALMFWADPNHWCLSWFKMSCCTWALFKTLVFVGMLTAKSLFKSSKRATIL